MFWRALREEDLISCLDIDPRRVGAELVGKDRAIEAWKALMRSGVFQSAVIESDPPVAGHRIVAFGAAVFVSRAFADQEISNPRPGLNARVIASVDSGNPMVLSESQLRSANTDGGLDLVILCPQLRKDILDADQTTEAQMLIASAFVELHVGFRLNRFLIESLDDEERRDLVEASGVWKSVSHFEEFYRAHPETPWSRSRSLSVVTKEEAFRVPGQVTGVLFTYREPLLDLQPSEQELLSAALIGLTDEELADKLGLRLPAVKKRWRSIFERASARTLLFPKMRDGLDEGSRGRQKRHYILAYVREHREELRPFDSRKGR